MNGKLEVVLVHPQGADITALLRVIAEDSELHLRWHCTVAAALADPDRYLPCDLVLLSDVLEERAIDLVRHVMETTPIPIAVVASRAETPECERLLMAGALDVVAPPGEDDQRGVAFCKHLRNLSRVTVVRRHRRRGQTEGRRLQPVVAIAASTGGPEILSRVLPQLHGLGAPVLLVQHIHPAFLDGLVDWLNGISAIPVEVVTERRTMLPDRVYMAPNGRHLVMQEGDRVGLATPQGPGLHVPSANDLFESVAARAQARAVGVILTGMGDDGARGLAEIYRNGGQTMVQDEASSTVFGMARAALKLCPRHRIVPATEIADAVMRAVARMGR